MESHQQHQALPSPKDEFFQDPSDDPLQVCRALKTRILYFIAGIEELLANVALTDNLDFLDAMATHIVTLATLIHTAKCCSDSLTDAKNIVDTIITCNVLVKHQNFSLSTLDAAKIYRKNRKNKEPLSSLLKAYAQEKDQTQNLLNELKLLAFDLNEEMENT